MVALYEIGQLFNINNNQREGLVIMKKILIIILLVFIAGCAKKYTKAPEAPAAAPQETVREEVIQPKEEVIEEPVIPEQETVAERPVTAVTSIEEKAKQALRDILFDYDQYAIRPDARPVLDNIASFLNNNKNLNVVIEGHCDENGTDDYNLALGEKRAKATRDYLVSLGISSTRMITITYGEEKPLCTQHDESCWQINRRAHFGVVKN